MNEVLASFTKSLQRLEDALAAEPSDLARDAAIQRFEFTVELAWKSIQKFLREEKIICRSPKECLQEAFQMNLVVDNPLWIAMLDDRNLTVHTYNEQTAKEIFSRLPNYLPLFHRLSDELRKRLGDA